MRGYTYNFHRYLGIDVGFLYEIVLRAEQKPESEKHPFPALFTAHDEVVKEHGVHAVESDKVETFLFKMGEGPFRGQLLLDRFSNVLEEMGIVLAIDGHESDSKFDTTSGDNSNDGSGEFTVPVDNWESRNSERRDVFLRDEGIARHPRRRRASFDSTYDIGRDGTQQNSPNRPSSRSSMSRLEVGKTDFPGSERKSQKAAITNFPDWTQLAQLLEARDRLRLKQERRESADKPLPNGFLSESELQRNKVYQESLALQGRPLDFSPSSDESESSMEDGGGININENQGAMVDPVLDLLRIESGYHVDRRLVVARHILARWREKVMQRKDSEGKAIRHYTNTLLKRIYDIWNRTYERLYYDSMKFNYGRDMALKAHAFTHWANVAFEEGARTYAARRHILSVRCFSAWKTLTVSNEFIVQQFSQRRAFILWRGKNGQIKAGEAKAVNIRNQNLQRAKFWEWVYTFCDRHATERYRLYLKRRSLLLWLRGFRQNSERTQEIDNNNRRKIVGSVLRNWSAIVSDEQEADTACRRRLLTKAFEEWGIQASLAHSTKCVSRMVDERVLCTAYAQWAQRARILGEVTEMGRLNILRDAWTAWNDLLRCKALSARIKERIQFETVHSWVLAARFQLMQRIKDFRVIRKVFSNFVTNIRSTYDRLQDQKDIFEERRNEVLLRSKLVCWRNEITAQHQRECDASRFYALRLKQETLAVWLAECQNVVKLEARARDARFYFLATRTLKAIQERRIKTAKSRLQGAYAMVRRSIKCKAVSKAFINWKEESQHVMDMDQQAFQFYRKNSLKIVSGLFSHWQNETVTRVQLVREADDHYSRRVTYDQLVRWAERFGQFRDMQEHSNQLYYVHVLGQAGAQLRKLSLRIFQINSSVETADSFRARNLKKNTRIMIRRWTEETKMAIAARGSPGPALSPSTDFDMHMIDETSQPIIPPYQVESPFRFSDLLPISPSSRVHSSVTPNRITSPSKLATRARELAQTSTTPSTPLYTPFAGRVLRHQVETPNIASSTQRRRIRKSPPGTSVRFVDQEEPESPTEGRRSANRGLQDM